MPSDWMFNHDLSSGRLKCHGNGDIVRGKNMDWARVEGPEYVKQKLFLYFAIPPGEIINDPEVGCCLIAEPIPMKRELKLEIAGLEGRA